MSRRRQQSYIKISATGEASGVFPGGVEILAGVNATPPDARTVKWVRESNGAFVASVAAWESGGGAESNARLQARDPATSSSAEIVASTTSPERVTASVTDGVGVFTKRILDVSGHSDFVMATDLDTMEIDWTGVNLDFYVNGVLVKSI